MAGQAVKVAVNASVNLLAYSITVLLGLITYPIVISLIGIEAVGIYALIMAVLAPLDVTNFGLSEANIKYVAEYAEAKDFEKVKRYLSTTLLMNWAIGGIGFIIIGLAGPPIAFAVFNFEQQPYDVITWCFWTVGAGWLVRQLTTYFMSIPMALLNFKIVAVMNLVTTVVTTAAVLLTTYLYQSIVGYAFGTLIGAAISLLIWAIVVPRKFPQISFAPKFHTDIWRSAFSYGGWQTLSSLSSVISNQIDKYLIGIYLSNAASGVYNVTLQIQQRVLSAVFKIAEVLFPTFSAASNQSNKAKFDGLVKASFVMTVISILVFMSIIPFTYEVLKLWINEEFAMMGDKVAKAIFAVGTMGCLSVPSIFFLRGNAKVKSSTVISYITAAVTVAGSFFFIRSYGLPGAGYGAILALFVRMIITEIFIRNYMKEAFSSWSFWLATWIPTIFGAALVFVVDYFDLLTPTGWISLFADGALMAVALAVVVIGVTSIPARGRQQNLAILAVGRQFAQVVTKRKD